MLIAVGHHEDWHHRLTRLPRAIQQHLLSHQHIRICPRLQLARLHDPVETPSHVRVCRHRVHQGTRGHPQPHPQPVRTLHVTLARRRHAFGVAAGIKRDGLHRLARRQHQTPRHGTCSTGEHDEKRRSPCGAGQPPAQHVCLQDLFPFIPPPNHPPILQKRLPLSRTVIRNHCHCPDPSSRHRCEPLSNPSKCRPHRSQSGMGPQTCVLPSHLANGLAVLSLGPNEAIKRAPTAHHLVPLPHPEPHPRLLGRVSPRRLVRSVELHARRVRHTQLEAVPLGEPINPPDQLLHVSRLRRQLARGVFCRHIVRLHKQHLSSQPLSPHRANAPNAQQLTPIDRPALLGCREPQTMLLPASIQPQYLAGPPPTGIRAREHALPHRHRVERGQAPLLEMHPPPPEITPEGLAD